MSLYADGKLVGTQTGEHVFVFENVPIAETGTVLTAKAGDYTDTIRLRSVAEKLEKYTFPGFK